MNLDMIEYKAMCCTFSTTSIQQLWIGASKGTLLFYDLPGTPGTPCLLIRPTRIYSLESFTSAPIQPPVQCVGHLSGRAGCFFNLSKGEESKNERSVKGLTIMTQGGKVWVLEGYNVDDTVVPLDFVTPFWEVMQMDSCYDVRVVDITISTPPNVTVKVPDNSHGEKTHVVACLLVSSKADPVKVNRFLLLRGEGRWVGVLLSEFSGHSVFMSLPRPVATCIPYQDNPYPSEGGFGFVRDPIYYDPGRDLRRDRYRNRDTLIIGCPESTSSMRVWVESMKKRHEVHTIMEDYRVLVPSQVLSMTFINPVKDSNSCDVIDLRAGEGAGTGTGTGVGARIGSQGSSGSSHGLGGGVSRTGSGSGTGSRTGSGRGEETGTGSGVETGSGTGVATSTAAALTDMSKKNGNVILRILATTPESVYLYSMTMLEYDHFVKLNSIKY